MLTSQTSVAGRACVFAALLLCMLGVSIPGAAAQTLTTDTFVGQVRGEWQGSGEYGGNSLALSRSWELVLRDQFLRADMRVSMPNGFSFGALMFWKLTSDNVYDVVWMDGTGRSQELRATRNAETGVVSATYLDEFVETGPEWRTWEFESLGPDSYVERLYRVAGETREELTVFRFRRVEGG